eukprot:scaffold29882_cov63-Phaeocystis_antarctica.AAC.1
MAAAAAAIPAAFAAITCSSTSAFAATAFAALSFAAAASAFVIFWASACAATLSASASALTCFRLRLFCDEFRLAGCRLAPSIRPVHRGDGGEQHSSDGVYHIGGSIIAIDSSAIIADRQQWDGRHGTYLWSEGFVAVYHPGCARIAPGGADPCWAQPCWAQAVVRSPRLLVTTLTFLCPLLFSLCTVAFLCRYLLPLCARDKKGLTWLGRQLSTRDRHPVVGVGSEVAQRDSRLFLRPIAAYARQRYE